MHCFLCGARDEQQRARMRDPRELQALVRHRCVPTPFLYAHVAHTPIPDEVGLVPVCLPCIHWTRRCKLYQHKRAHARGGAGGAKPSAAPRQHMLVDSIIASVLQPGLAKNADPRCMHRLAACMASDDYLYGWVVPAPVRAILRAMRGRSEQHAAALAWWEYNGRTEFFPNSRVARAVRQALHSAASEP